MKRPEAFTARVVHLKRWLEASNPQWVDGDLLIDSGSVNDHFVGLSRGPLPYATRFCLGVVAHTSKGWQARWGKHWERVLMTGDDTNEAVFSTQEGVQEALLAHLPRLIDEELYERVLQAVEHIDETLSFWRSLLLPHDEHAAADFLVNKYWEDGRFDLPNVREISCVVVKLEFSNGRYYLLRKGAVGPEFIGGTVPDNERGEWTHTARREIKKTFPELDNGDFYLVPMLSAPTTLGVLLNTEPMNEASVVFFRLVSGKISRELQSREWTGEYLWMSESEMEIALNSINRDLLNKIVATPPACSVDGFLRPRTGEVVYASFLGPRSTD